jgi:hypothetical protein
VTHVLHQLAVAATILLGLYGACRAVDAWAILDAPTRRVVRSAGTVLGLAVAAACAAYLIA